MKILQSNDSFRPIMDGVGVCMENYAHFLGRLEHDVAVVAPWVPERAGGEQNSPEAPGPEEPFDLLRYLSLPLPGWKPYRLGVPRLDPTFAYRLSRWIDRAGHLDLVHSHSPFVAGKLAGRIAHRHGAIHVTTFHSKYRDDFLKSFPSERLADLFVHRLVRFYERADAVWTPSKATAETLKSYGYGGEVTVMPNGADLTPPTDEEYQAYRQSGTELLGLSGNREGRRGKEGDTEPFVLLFVGQHRWEKNLRLIVDGLANLDRNDQARVRAVFAGTGSDRKEIEEYADKHGVADICDFRGLVLDREVLKALYARAELFVFPSLYDNAPLVLREAAAFRTPAVLAAGSSAAADTEDGRNAYHVAPDAPSLARLLDRLRKDPAEINRVGCAAQREVYRSWEGIVGEVAERYAALIEARQKGRG